MVIGKFRANFDPLWLLIIPLALPPCAPLSACYPQFGHSFDTALFSLIVMRYRLDGRIFPQIANAIVLKNFLWSKARSEHCGKRSALTTTGVL